VLFERYETRLQAAASAMLGDRELARDVVQDTAVELSHWLASIGSAVPTLLGRGCAGSAATCAGGGCARACGQSGRGPPWMTSRGEVEVRVTLNVPSAD
jgi:hypothetical protein